MHGFRLISIIYFCFHGFLNIYLLSKSKSHASKNLLELEPKTPSLRNPVQGTLL